MRGALSTEGLTRVYPGGGGIKDVDALFYAEDLTCVIGPSGSGKSTLLRLLAGLETPDRGHIHWNGAEANEDAPKRSMVFQQPKLLPHLSVAANIALPLTIQDRDRFGLFLGRVPTKRMETVRELARLLRIETLIDRDIRTLSGGEAQRVALARALAADAQVYLLDEPLAAVDERQRAEFSALLREVIRKARERASLILYVTHDLEEAFSLADRVAVVIDGRLEQFGTSEQVFRKPANVDVASFICKGALWQWRGMVENTPNDAMILRRVDGRIQLHNIGGLETCRRNQEITVAVRGLRIGSERSNSIGRVVSVEGFAPYQRVHADIMGERVTLPLVYRALGESSSIYVESEDILLFD